MSSTVPGQTFYPSISGKIMNSEKYLFYLHGGVVTELGDNAINPSRPEWGPYEYHNILDSLRKRGFNVISENRKKGIDDSVYISKIVGQIDSLLQSGAKTENIIVVGASAGWNIAIHASSKLKNKEMKYVIMGGCWPDAYKDYINMELYGNFLSIIEITDPRGTCNDIFQNRKHIATYKEVKLNTGLSHGFIYKGYKEWINPIVKWFENSN